MAKGKAKKRMQKQQAKREAEEKQVLCSSSWEDLPDDILDLILQKLVFLSDIIRFSSVCKSWNSKALIHKQKFMPLVNHQPPLLLIYAFPGKKQKRRNQGFYNLTNGSKIPRNNFFKLRIPYEFTYKHCFGSSFGWLLYREIGNTRSGIIILLNPLSGTVIRLPPISIPCDKISCVEFLVLSNDPYLGSFEVLASCSDPKNYNIVAHLRFGDESWTFSEWIGRTDFFCSFAFYKSCIFGLSMWGRIWSLRIIHSSDGSSSRIKFKEIAVDLDKGRYISHLSNFVETPNGDLLMVCNYCTDRNYFNPQKEYIYKIFKIICLKIGQFDIIPVEKLDGYSLFLETNISSYSYQCSSVLASNFAGCRANTIYHWRNKSYRFTEDGRIFKCIIEEFNLEDRSFKRNEKSFRIAGSSIHYAFWLVPSINHACRLN